MAAKTPNQVLDESKDKFDQLLVVGLKNGQIDVLTTNATYQFCQWILDRAKFELLITERASLGEPQ